MFIGLQLVNVSHKFSLTIKRNKNRQTYLFSVEASFQFQAVLARYQRRLLLYWRGLHLPAPTTLPTAIPERKKSKTKQKQKSMHH